MSSADEHMRLPVTAGAKEARGEHTAAFTGLLLFTLLLYLRPNEMFPEIFGTFPVIKIVALLALATYVGSRLSQGQRLTIWPLELKMLIVIILLGAVLMPLAANPADSMAVLTDTLLKIFCIFVLMINLINTRARLHQFFKVVVICGGILAVFAIKNYITGEVSEKTGRIQGVVGGMFGNPNDLATSFDMLLPLGAFLALTNRGMKRTLYLAVCAILVIAVILTFSRSGFLGLLAATGVTLWKVGRDRRALAATAFVALVGVFTFIMPAGYSLRLLSIFNIQSDPTGSAQLRRDQLDRALTVAMSRPIVGVGLGNYHIYSLREQRAHNSYLEISAELGVAGLIAYMILLIGPLRALWRIERETTPPAPRRAALSYGRSRSPDEDPDKQENRYLSIALQASLAAYIVCSFFASIQYQWYLYYLIAYAIAFSRMYEAAAQSADPERATKAAQKAKGVAWGMSRRTRAASGGAASGD